MPSFLRRLKHPCRRPTHYYTYAEPRPTPSQLARIRERDGQKAEDGRENDLDDGFIVPSHSTERTELPVVIDRGAYGPLEYPSEELYYNSIMYANDVEPPYRGGLHQPLRQEVHKTPTRRHFVFRGGQKPYPRPEPNEHLTAAENGLILRRWNEWHGKYTGTKKHEEQIHPLKPEPKDGINVMAMRGGGSERRVASPQRPPALPPSPRREPISPGTQEWDNFMNFPSEHSTHIYRQNESDQLQTLAARDAPTAVSSPSASPKSTIMTEAPSSTPNEAGFSSASSQTTDTSAQTQTHSQSLTTTPIETGERETLTWNSVLNRILNHEAVNPETREAVRERVQRSSTTNGSGHADTHPVAAVNVGIVPNFSYPVTGSAFHDCLLAEQPHPQPIVYEISATPGHSPGREQELTNGVSPDHYSHSSSSDTLYRPPTPASSLTGRRNQAGQLTNGVPAGYYDEFSSSDSSLGDGLHLPLPPDRVPDLVFALLCEHLTASERSLHRRIVTPTELSRSPPGFLIVPASNAASPIPLDVRLVQKLHTAVYGLQDRIDGLEEDLLPQLSKWLEDKANHIEELNTEVVYVQEEIGELKRIVDFGNRVLAGCWEREWEMWRTLLDIRKHREMKRSRLSRMLRRRKSFVEREYLGLEGMRPEGYVAKGSGSGLQREGLEGVAQQRPLDNRELKALLLMAEQNVRIIKEDMEEMVELVQAWQERAEREELEDKDVAPEEGS
jgi:hypothetical protein